MSSGAQFDAADEEEEHFDVLDARGALTGERRSRSEVHSLGLWHRAVQIWLWSPWTGGGAAGGWGCGELLLQHRAACKDSWPDRWYISCAGHVSAGDASLPAALRELGEELGPAVAALAAGGARLDFLFEHCERMQSTQRGRFFLNHEFNDIYVLAITPAERAALEPAGGAFALQATEVDAVRWVDFEEVRRMYAEADPAIVPCHNWPALERGLFVALRARRDAAVRAEEAAAAKAAADAGEGRWKDDGGGNGSGNFDDGDGGGGDDKRDTATVEGGSGGAAAADATN